MNKILHAVILVVFVSACWCLSLVLKLPAMLDLALDHNMPLFTNLCARVGPVVMAGLAILAAAYCLYVWTRKTESHATWVSFLAATMSALVLMLLPILGALYLPLIEFANRTTLH
jgi:purine-cytosine permease-like protein